MYLTVESKSLELVGQQEEEPLLVRVKDSMLDVRMALVLVVQSVFQSVAAMVDPLALVMVGKLVGSSVAQWVEMLVNSWVGS